MSLASFSDCCFAIKRLHSVHVTSDSWSTWKIIFFPYWLRVLGWDFSAFCRDISMLWSIFFHKAVLVTLLVCCFRFITSILWSTFSLIRLECDIKIFLIALNLFDSLIDSIDFAGNIFVVFKFVVLPSLFFRLSMNIFVVWWVRTWLLWVFLFESINFTVPWTNLCHFLFFRFFTECSLFKISLEMRDWVFCCL